MQLIPQESGGALVKKPLNAGTEPIKGDNCNTWSWLSLPRPPFPMSPVTSAHLLRL